MTATVTPQTSPAQRLARLPATERRRILEGYGDARARALYADWRFWARPKQIAPEGDWRWWVVCTGRGFGKTRTGSEWVCDRAERFAAADARHLVGLVGRTFNRTSALQIHGESGLEPVCERRGMRLEHAGSSLDGSLWCRRPDVAPGVGGRWHETRLEVHTADDPDRARGPNFHTAWLEEMSSWRHKQDQEGGTTLTNVDLALRGLCPPGVEPQGIVTMTPKPIAPVRDALAGKMGRTVITRGSLVENAANLAPSYVEAILLRYGGSRLGQQEIEGMILDIVEGALWTPVGLEQDRVFGVPDLDRIVVGVDPPGETVTEAGIVVVGAHYPEVSGRKDRRRGHAYVLDDVSLAGTPEEWGQQVVDAYREWEANAAVVEVNHGGDMCRATIHAVDPTVKVEKVRASRGKKVRAEPVSAVSDQHRLHLVGYHGDLEGELTTHTFDPDEMSPNRLDAMVWAVSEALGLIESGGRGRSRMRYAA